MFYLEQPEQFDDPIEVVGCFVEHNGKILQLERNPNKPEGLTFGRPSGKVDAEDINHQYAIARELFEETGIQAAPEQFKEVATFYVVNELLNKNFEFHNYKLAFEQEPEVKLNPSEHIAYVWATKDQALSAKLMVEEDKCLDYYYKHVYQR